MARIGVVGGGIIGTTIAARLILDKHDVTVFEADPGGIPASAGNAGLIAIPEIEPLASPATLRAAPRWLLDPDGPLAIKFPFRPSLLPWLVRFALNARPDKIARSRLALAALQNNAEADHQHLAASTGLSGHMRETGAISIYDSPAAIDAAMAEGQHIRELLGLECERLSRDQARDRVPELEGPFAGAVHLPAYRTVTHPQKVLNHYRAFVSERGTLTPSRIDEIAPERDGVILKPASSSPQTFDYVIVAAGIWSRELVRGLRLHVQLETERGYNTTYQNPSITLPLPIFFGEHGFIASPLENALRIGGAVELASPSAPPSRSRAAAMRRKMRRYVPSLPETGGVEWMGCRPSTPDSLPVISRNPRDPRILFAFGHGHLGLTLSATTARHIAELVAGTADAEMLAPYSIDRFQ